MIEVVEHERRIVLLGIWVEHGVGDRLCDMGEKGWMGGL